MSTAPHAVNPQPGPREIVTVYAAGVVQGIALVTFPAVSVVLTGAADYGLSNQEYGELFVPQAITAAVAALLGASITRRLGAKRLFLAGLGANFMAMALLVLSTFFMRKHGASYACLLAATASLGIGFGFTVPTVNLFAAAFFPKKIEKAVLALNALIGLGTMLAPIFVLIFVRAGVWWCMPVLVAVLLAVLCATAIALPLPGSVRQAAGASNGAPKLPARFWLYAAFALVYGICETMNGNWAAVYMVSRLGAGTAQASVALTLFWGSVTAGRVLFAALDNVFSAAWVFRTLPLIVAAAFLVTAWLPRHALWGILAFSVAGLGCSALLPLLISFAQEELSHVAATVAGGLICVYQLGYGVAAFGVGPLQSRGGAGLDSIYAGCTAVALIMAVLATVLVRKGAGER